MRHTNTPLFERRRFVTHKLNVLSRAVGVEWDRTSGPASAFNVFGWIRREDGGRDFVVVGFEYSEVSGYATSSARHSLLIGRLLYGSADYWNHYPCVPVSGEYPEVESLVSWEDPPSRRRWWQKRERRSE